MGPDTQRNLTNAANALSAAADALLEMAKELEREHTNLQNQIDAMNERVYQNEKFRRDLASFLQSYTN